MRKDILNEKEKIMNWIKDNQPKSFICRELKCKPFTLDSYLNKMNIEYKGNMGLKGKKISNKRTHSSLYLKNGSIIGSHKLKIKLIRDGIKEKKCEICGITEWNGIEAPLELHHIDGNRFNNELSNLQIICSNCHSQTSNFNIQKGLKRKIKISKEEKEIKIKEIKKDEKYYCSCGREIEKRSKNCSVCDKIRQRKIKERPSLEKLLKEVSETNYVKTGKKYGVSDNCIRKWIKQYKKIGE